MGQDPCFHFPLGILPSTPQSYLFVRCRILSISGFIIRAYKDDAFGSRWSIEAETAQEKRSSGTLAALAFTEAEWPVA